MPEDKQMAEGNERIRQEKLAAERAAIKKHGKDMERAITGGNSDKGCFGLILLIAATPLLYAAHNLMQL